MTKKFDIMTAQITNSLTVYYDIDKQVKGEELAKMPIIYDMPFNNCQTICNWYYL